MANKEDTRIVNLANEEYILYRVPIEKLCGICNGAISDILDDNEGERKVLIEFYRTEEKKKCPAIKQININRLMY